MTATITITPVDDSIAEDDEIAQLVAKSTVLTGSDETGITIEDNDTEPVEVVLTVSPDTLHETSGTTALNVTASLVGQATRQVDTVVTVTVGSGTATLGEDFESAEVTLTILDEELSAAGTLNLTVTDDTLHEGDETLHISGSVTGLTVTAADVTITDDDAAPTSIGLSVTAVPITEGGGAVALPVHATLLGGGTRVEDTTVDLSLVDVTATLDDDYTAAWGTTVLTIPAGEFSSNTTLTITPVQDTLHEEPETVAVRGSNTDPGLPVNGVRLTITDDDPAPTTVELEVNPGTITEGTVEPSVEVVATLEGNSTLQEDVRIDISLVSSDPMSQADIRNFLTLLVITSGQSSGTSTMVLTGLDDDVDDDDETLELQGTASDSSLSVLPVQLVITNDDTAGVTISEASLEIEEGSSDTYNVVLDTEPLGNVTVAILDPSDNSDVTSDPASLTFTTDNWDTPQTVTVATEKDNDGDDETATIKHDVSGYGSVTANDVSVNVTDDAPETVAVSFQQGSYTVSEGSTVTVKIVLDVDPERTVTIPVTIDNRNGASSADYSGVPADIVFNPADTEKTFTFTAAADNVDDDGETVDLAFGALPTGVAAGTPDGATVSITDDDDPAVAVSFQQDSYTVAEGSTVTVKIVLDVDPERTVTIPVTIDNRNGASTADYSGVPANVVFNAADTEKTFTFTAADDDFNDDGETVDLAFGALPTGVVAGTPDGATVSITDDDDPAVAVSFQQDSYTVAEGSSVTVKIVLDVDPERTVTIPVTKDNRNGASTADYSGVPANVVFNAADTEKTFTFTAADDDFNDDGETVGLGFGALPTGVVAGTPDETTVSIIDDDEYIQEQIQTTTVQTECPADSGRRILLNRVEEITQEGQSQFLRVKLDPERLYLIEVYGSDSPSDIMGDDTYSENLTLEGPRVLGVWNDDRTMKLQGRGSGNQVDLLRGSIPTGWHWLEITGNGSTGTYRIKVRVNNICITSNGLARYPWMGGPDGYVLDAPDYIHSSDSTQHTSRNPLIHQDRASGSGWLGNNWDWYWDEVPDVDWYEWNVLSSELGQTYEIDVWASEKYPAIHQATDLEIKGIYDAQGNLLEGTSRSGTGSRVTIAFEPSDAGKYYIAVGSGATDRTGMYEIKIVKPG